MEEHSKLEMAGQRHTHAHTHAHDECDDDEVQEAFQPATVFDAQYVGEEVPEGFDAVRIVLDGTVKGDLAWQKEREATIAYVQKGLRLFWEIDLGLFERLKYALGNHTQFLSLSLSLEHYRDTLWKEFRTHTCGLCLYRGPADISVDYKWDEEQLSNLQGWLQDLFGDIAACAHETGLSLIDFKSVTPQILQLTAPGQRLLSLFCGDAAGEYLQLLAARLPDTINSFVLLDAGQGDDFALKAQLLSKERYPHLLVGVKNSSGLGGEFAWEGEALSLGRLARTPHALQRTEPPRYGVCLPSLQKRRYCDSVALNEIFATLIERKCHFRVIPESILTTEWHGLDCLFVVSDLLSPQGRRKLQGFCAAGGVVVIAGKPIGLPEEQSFANWICG